MRYEKATSQMRTYTRFLFLILIGCFATLDGMKVKSVTPIPPISQWPLRADGGTGTKAAGGEELKGLGVSPGVARGRARVAAGLADLTDLEPGDIIVCSTTDPSWVPLFLLAGGVVCDIGAPSSHAAIVSREIGVPFVVSVTRARDRIADGTPVEIDGLAGTVRVLQDAAG